MATFLSSIAGRLREILGNRRQASRRTARVPARVPFTIALLDPQKDAAKAFTDKGALTGQTSDLSETGMTLLLPSVRIGDSYLTQETHYLLIELRIPSGPVTILGSPVRFAYTAGAGYLLGIRIVKMQEEEYTDYLTYLRALSPRERRVRKQREDAVRAQTIPGRGFHQSSAWASITPTNVSDAFERFLRER